MQLYRIHTSAWAISGKFAASLQNTFSEQNLWRAASGHLHYNQKQGKQHYIANAFVLFVLFGVIHT